MAVTPTVTVLLFAGAREAAGTGRAAFTAPSLSALLEEARVRFGPEFTAVLGTARVWINGEPPPDGVADPLLQEGDEVAVLPPVSGG